MANESGVITETATGAFAPIRHLRSLRGQQYLDVKWRLVWLRQAAQ